MKIAVRAIIVHDGKLLCAQAKPYGPHVQTGIWGVPGGTVDDNEALIPALKREMIEELGVEPEVGNLLYVQQYKIPDGGVKLELFFHIKNAKDYLNVDLSKTSHGHLEIEKLEFIDPGQNDIQPTLLTTEPLTDLNDRPTRIFSYL